MGWNPNPKDGLSKGEGVGVARFFSRKLCVTHRLNGIRFNLGWDPNLISCTTIITLFGVLFSIKNLVPAPSYFPFKLRVIHPLTGAVHLLDILFLFNHKISQKVFRSGPNPDLNLNGLKFKNNFNQKLCSGDYLLSPSERVSSALQGLTSEFGMRSGVTPASNHQNKNFD